MNGMTGIRWWGRMRRNRGLDLKTGLAFMRSEFFNLSIYRASFWMNLVYTFLMMYSVGYVWRALYASNPGAAGTGLPQMISYAVIGVALEAIMHPYHGPKTYMAEQVRKGSIELDLMKPMDFEFYMFAKNMGNIMVRFLFLVLPSLIAAYFLFSLELPDLPQLAGFLASLALGVLVSFLLNFMLGMVGMVTMNIRNINFAYNAVLRFFSGQMIPLWIFPGVLGVLGGHTAVPLHLRGSGIDLYRELYRDGDPGGAWAAACLGRAAACRVAADDAPGVPARDDPGGISLGKRGCKLRLGGTG